MAAASRLSLNSGPVGVSECRRRCTKGWGDVARYDTLAAGGGESDEGEADSAERVSEPNGRVGLHDVSSLQHC